MKKGRLLLTAAVLLLVAAACSKTDPEEPDKPGGNEPGTLAEG